MIGDRGNKKQIIKGAQIVFGFAALVWVVSNPDWTAIRSGLSQLTVRTIVAIVVVSIVGLLARFTMWTALLDRYGIKELWTTGRIELSVNFVNQLLPSRLSGRVVAPLVVRQNTGIEWERAVAVSIAHTGLFALLYSLLSFSGLLAGILRFPYSVSVLIFVSTGLYFFAGAVILGTASGLDGIVGRWLDAASRLPGVRRVRMVISDRLLDFPLDIAAIAPLLRSLIADPRILLSYSSGWVVALAIAPGIRLWLLFEGMGASFSPVWLLPLFAIAAYSVTLLPLTPGGIGVTEATATLVFVAVGVPSAVVVPAVLIDRFVGVYLPALAGWYPSLSIGLEEFREEYEMDEP